MALLSFRGISTPSLPAQGEQRRSSYFNSPRGNSPLMSVGLMTLVEDGVVQLTDPVSKYLPPFKDVKVSTPNGDVAPDSQ